MSDRAGKPVHPTTPATDTTKVVVPLLDPPAPRPQPPPLALGTWGAFEGGNLQAEWLPRKAKPLRKRAVCALAVLVLAVAYGVDYAVIALGFDWFMRVSANLVALSLVAAIIFNLRDDRRMMTLRAIVYVDPDGERWDVPIGTVIDGASIPRLFWRLIGDPFSGYYRTASAVHDRYCDTKLRPWRAVHRMFYRAMRCEGCAYWRASLMYFAVRGFGPRWTVKE